MKRIVKKTNDKIIYQDDDKIIKTYSDHFTTSQVLNEALNQSKIYEAGLSTPKIHEVKFYDDRIGIVMDYVDGKILSELITEDSTNIDSYIDLFANVHHKLITSSISNLNNSYDRIKNKIFSSKLSATSKYALFYKLQEMEFSRDVIHGDFTLSNIIISSNKEPFIIDWSHVAFGNKRFDIAVTYALFIVDDNENIADIYLEKICTLEHIEKKSVIDELILAYIYIVDRFNSNIQDKIYDKIYDIIKEKET